MRLLAKSCSYLVTVFLFCGCMVGCPAETPEEAEKEPEPWQGKLQIERGGWKDLKRLIEDNKGKVIIADLWTTWSKSSIRELPHLAELQKKYGESVVCIAVNMDHSLDNPKPSQEKMEKILRDRFGTVLEPNEELSGAFPFFVSEQPDENFARDAGDIGVRSILIYDRNGERTVVNLGTAEDRVVLAYNKMLAELEKKKQGKTKKTSEKTKEEKPPIPEAEVLYEKDVIPVLAKILGPSS